MPRERHLEAGGAVELRHGGQKRAGIGMGRALQHLGGLAELDDLAEIHDRDPVGDMTDDSDIMGDEEVGQMQPALQLAQQIQDLRLDRDVQRRGRLVQHQEARLQRQRAGDGDALALAAGEFMGIAVEQLGPQADLLGKPHDAGLALGRAQPVRHGQRLGDDAGHRHARIQRALRVLEHDLEAPAERGQRLARGRPDIGAVEQHLARRRPLQAHDGLAQRGLAAARFADDAQGLAAPDLEVDAVQRMDMGLRAGPAN